MMARCHEDAIGTDRACNRMIVCSITDQNSTRIGMGSTPRSRKALLAIGVDAIVPPYLIKPVLCTACGKLRAQHFMLGSRQDGLRKPCGAQSCRHLCNGGVERRRRIACAIECHPLRRKHGIKALALYIQPQTAIIFFHGEIKDSAIPLDTRNERQAPFGEHHVDGCNANSHVIKHRTVEIPDHMCVFHH